MSVPINFDAQWWHLTRYEDPEVEANGFDVKSKYVEEFWTPVLGPTSVIMLRHFGGIDEAGSYLLNLELAPYLFGIGPHRGRNSTFGRTINRLQAFGMLRTTDRADELEIRTTLPALPGHMVRNTLHPAIRDRHEMIMKELAE